MEYRDYYCGDMTIPEEKRSEFTDRILTIMDQGGLMGLEQVKLFNKELTLLTPPRFDADNNVCVNFSYFEYEEYDPIHYNADTARMSCGYIDLRGFFSASIAAWVLREFYASSFGIAHYKGTLMPLTRTIDWLNYLFSEQYDNRRAADIWKIYQLFPKDIRWKQNYAKLHQEHSSTIGALKYIVCADKDINPLDKDDYVEFQKRVVSMYPIKEMEDCLESILYDNKNTNEKLDAVKRILTTPESIYEDEVYVRFAKVSKELPCEVSIKLVSDFFHVDYSDLMAEIGDASCAAAKPQEKRECEISAIPKLPTTEFFRCDNDDRVYWWTESGDVIFSAEMERWINELSGEYRTILHTHALIGMEGETAARYLVDEFHRIGVVFGKLFCFRDFFYEYLTNAADTRYQAAALLLSRLINRLGSELPKPAKGKYISPLDKENSLPRRRMKRYLALLANRGLRLRVLGF